MEVFCHAHTNIQLGDNPVKQNELAGGLLSLPLNNLHSIVGFEGVCSLHQKAGSDACLCDGPVCSLGLLESYEGFMRIA